MEYTNKNNSELSETDNDKVCGTCNGTGEDPYKHYPCCPDCGGTGKVN